jgi:hypothetical protein
MSQDFLMKFDARPDFEGLGQFSAHGCALGDHECCFFLPAREVAKMWVLVKAVVAAENPLALNWRFSCQLKADDAILIAEEIFHSGYTEWDWGNGPENTLIGEITRLKVNRGDVGSSAISKVRFSATPSALLRSADIIAEKNGTGMVRTVVRRAPFALRASGLHCDFILCIGVALTASWSLASSATGSSHHKCRTSISLPHFCKMPLFSHLWRSDAFYC